MQQMFLFVSPASVVSDKHSVIKKVLSVWSRRSDPAAPLQRVSARTKTQSDRIKVWTCRLNYDGTCLRLTFGLWYLSFNSFFYFFISSRAKKQSCRTLIDIASWHWIKADYYDVEVIWSWLHSFIDFSYNGSFECLVYFCVPTVSTKGR